MTFDDTIPYIGQFGPYQRWVYMCLCLPAVSIAIQSMASVFTMAVPEFRCKLPDMPNDTYHIQSEAHRDAISAIIPRGDNDISKCKIYNGSTLLECSEWVYDTSVYRSTLISELDLVCHWRMGRSHVQMFFMLGSLLGLLVLGPPADVFGRKKVMMASLFLQMIAALSISFTPSFIYLCIFSVLNGMGCNTLYSVTFVLGMEIVGPEKRGLAGFVNSIVFGLGVCLLAGLAYLLRDWQWLQLAISSAIGLLLVYYWIIPESPRWLVSRRRYEEANVILQKMARHNGQTIPAEVLDWENKATHEATVQEPIWRIITYPRLLTRTLIICFNWMVCSMTYYGLGLNVGDLAGSIYLNCLLYGSVECLAYVMCLLVVGRMGRKTMHLTCMLVAGLACTASPFPLVYGGTDYQWMTITFAIVGKFGVSGAFATIWLYSSELFPTVVRNSGLSFSSIGARIGGIISPYIANLTITLSGNLGQLLPLLIFGSLTLLAGLLALILPETKGTELPENFQDANRFGRSKSQDGFEHELETLRHSTFDRQV